MIKSTYMATGVGLRLAIELILRAVRTGILGPLPVKFRSMSSRLFPCVSGTHSLTNTKLSKHHAPYIRNGMLYPTWCPKSMKDLVIANVVNQLKLVAMEAADPLMRAAQNIHQDYCFGLKTYKFFY